MFQIDIDLNVDSKQGLTDPCPVSVGLANELPRENLNKKERIAIGYFADVYAGVLKGAGGAEMPVAIKVLREVGMASSRTPQERNERLNKVRRISPSSIPNLTIYLFIVAYRDSKEKMLPGAGYAIRIFYPSWGSVPVKYRGWSHLG